MINHSIIWNKFSIPGPVNRIASIVIVISMISFIMFKAFLLFVNSLKKNFDGKKMRFDYLSVAMMCMGILSLVFTNYTLVLYSFYEKLAMFFGSIGFIILLIYSIVEWLYKKQLRDD